MQRTSMRGVMCTVRRMQRDCDVAAVECEEVTAAWTQRSPEQAVACRADWTRRSRGCLRIWHPGGGERDRMSEATKRDLKLMDER
jgi:hypothetical protein